MPAAAYRLRVWLEGDLIYDTKEPNVVAAKKALSGLESLLGADRYVRCEIAMTHGERGGIMARKKPGEAMTVSYLPSSNTQRKVMCTVALDPETRAVAADLGEGNVSAGIRTALRIVLAHAPELAARGQTLVDNIANAAESSDPAERARNEQAYDSCHFKMTPDGPVPARAAAVLEMERAAGAQQPVDDLGF